MPVREWMGVKEVNDIENKIIEVEQFFGIKFPDDYKVCVRQNNAGYPVPDRFYFGHNNGEVFNNLLTFELESQFSIVNIYRRIKERVVDKVVIPSAITSALIIANQKSPLWCFGVKILILVRNSC